MHHFAQLTLAALAGAALTYVAVDETNEFVDADVGFRLELPDLGRGVEPGNLLHFYGPAADGFSPNVFLATQAFEGTMDDYVAESLAGLETMGLELVDHETYKLGGLPALRMEYGGDGLGPDLHFYAVAVLRDGEALVATGTCLEVDWKEHGEAFADSFDTLELFDPK